MASQRPQIAVFIAGLVLSGCSGGAPQGPTIRQAGVLSLYEGLPHPIYETEALAAEQKSKPTIDLHGYPFYRQPLVLKPGDDKQLRDVLGDGSSYRQHSGEKKCGGFHPDYAVVWSVRGQQSTDLICFTCQEIRRFGPAGEANFDIAAEVRERLKRLLASYLRDRPAHPFSGP